MKKLFIFLAAMLMAFAFQSCSDGKYTVWTDGESYAQFQTEFGTTIEDGHYRKIEISNDLWKQIAPNLTNEGKHYWSEAEIKKWLIGNGFGEYESTKESSWLVMTDHAFLAAREGNVVHLILK